MNPTKRLPASTLVEVLILMILGGIVFLSVMDGFGPVSYTHLTLPTT